MKVERHIFSFAQASQAFILFMLLHLLISCQQFIFFFFFLISFGWKERGGLTGYPQGNFLDVFLGLEHRPSPQHPSLWWGVTGRRECGQACPKAHTVPPEVNPTFQTSKWPVQERGGMPSRKAGEITGFIFGFVFLGQTCCRTFFKYILILRMCLHCLHKEIR